MTTSARAPLSVPAVTAFGFAVVAPAALICAERLSGVPANSWIVGGRVWSFEIGELLVLACGLGVVAGVCVGAHTAHALLTTTPDLRPRGLGFAIASLTPALVWGLAIAAGLLGLVP